MEMRLEKNNRNLFRKTMNFYSVTPRLKLSDLDYLSKLKLGGGILNLSELDSLSNFMGGYSAAIRAGLPVKFHWGGILQLSELDSLSNFTWGGRGGILNFRIGVFCRIWTKIGGDILQLSELDSLLNFTWGGILQLSELDSLSHFTVGGYSEFQNRGIL